MTRKASQKAKSTPEYDSQRETRVLLEDLNSNVKIVAEQHGSIVNKLEEHDRRFDGIDRRFDGIDRRFNGIESQLTSIKMAVMENGNKIEKVDNKLDAVTADHEQRIHKLESVK